MLCEIFKKVLLVWILGIISYRCEQDVFRDEIEEPRSSHDNHDRESVDVETEDGLEALATCTQRIAERSLEHRIAIFWQPNFPEQRIILDAYLMKISQDVSLHDYGRTHEKLFVRDPVKNIVMFSHDLEFPNGTEHIFNHENFDKNGKIAICLSVISWSKDLLLRISKELWKNRMANAILVVYDSGEDNVKIFGYWPSSEKGCTPTDVRLLVNNCNNDHSAIDNIFDRKMRNMHECPITASTISVGSGVTVYEEDNVRKVKGFEGTLFNTLAEVLNFTPVILPPPSTLWGDELPNGSWTGIRGQIKDGTADVGFAQIIPLNLRFEDYSVSISTGNIVWILPNASPVNWKKLILPFRPRAWTFIIIAVIGALIFAILEAIHRKIHPRLLTLWRICFAQSVDTNYESYATRIFIGTWIFFAFIITNAYLGSLVSSLTAVIQPENYESTRELLENNFPIGAVRTLGNLYGDPEDPVDYEIFRRFQVIEYIEFYHIKLDVINAKIRMALPVLEVTTVPFQRTGNFHIMKERAMDYPVVFVVPRGSPYISEFNLQMRRLKEGGFIDLWINRNENKEITSPEWTALRLVHMSSIFSLWLIGMGVSGMVFIYEIFYDYHQRQKVVIRADRGTRREFRKIYSSIRLYRG